MPDIRRRGRSAVAMIAAIVVATGLALTGCAAATEGTSGSGERSASPSDTSLPGQATHDQDPKTSSIPSPVTGVTVSSVSIPAIGVDAPTQLLTRDASGALNPPSNFTDTGWYAAGTLPGQIGPAVIAGHIDSDGGPAVFEKLNQLQPGDKVSISLSDGQTVSFAVDRSMQVSKGGFPTDAVYGPTPTAQLRLITCSGTFNPSIGHYDDNLVVFAHLVS